MKSCSPLSRLSSWTTRLAYNLLFADFGAPSRRLWALFLRAFFIAAVPFLGVFFLATRVVMFVLIPPLQAGCQSPPISTPGYYSSRRRCVPAPKHSLPEN